MPNYPFPHWNKHFQGHSYARQLSVSQALLTQGSSIKNDSSHKVPRHSMTNTRSTRSTHVTHSSEGTTPRIIHGASASTPRPQGAVTTKTEQSHADYSQYHRQNVRQRAHRSPRRAVEVGRARAVRPAVRRARFATVGTRRKRNARGARRANRAGLAAYEP